MGNQLNTKISTNSNIIDVTQENASKLFAGLPWGFRIIATVAATKIERGSTCDAARWPQITL